MQLTNTELLSSATKKRTCKPFIKWVGGKSQLRSEILRRFPVSYNRYFEPFVGGGAIFFSREHSDAVISDINEELINCYTVVKTAPAALIAELKKHKQNHSKEYFYKIRLMDRQSEFRALDRILRAARFIYLNKTCFNGLHRVNKSGHFNVPFGRYSNPAIADEDNIYACSEFLKYTVIKHRGFEQIESEIQAGDFVYFDPPYIPLTSTSNFTSYSKEDFDLKMQEDLADLCKRLDKKGINFLLSNSSAELIFDLYKDFKIDRISATRLINSKAEKRGAVDEVLISNY